MTPATLEQIGQLGHTEKQAAREFAWQDDAMHPAEFGATCGEYVERWAFLQGIAWERARGDLAVLGALRAVLQGMPMTMVTPAYRATLDRARVLLAKRLEVTK